MQNNNVYENLYDILNIDPCANEDEIKKAYKNLVLKYHPDKNNDIDANEKFIKIHSAYELLKDKDLRKKYDLIHNKDRQNFHKNLFEYFSKIYAANFNKFLSLLCDDKKYMYNINNNNYSNAFIYFIDKYLKKNNGENSLDIVDYVECNLIDRYNNYYSLIEVIRKTKNNLRIYVPLRNEINIIYNEGETKNGKNGDIILHTKTINNNSFFCKNGDMFKEIEIKKNNNDEKNITLLFINNNIHLDIIENNDNDNDNDNDNENNVCNNIIEKKINIDVNNIIDNKYIIINKMGLPLSDFDNDRGDLICEIKML
jgi:curved DNA-binding protein CbpA